jgi:hypothetical protein
VYTLILIIIQFNVKRLNDTFSANISNRLPSTSAFLLSNMWRLLFHNVEIMMTSSDQHQIGVTEKRPMHQLKSDYLVKLFPVRSRAYDSGLRIDLVLALITLESKVRQASTATSSNLILLSRD